MGPTLKVVGAMLVGRNSRTAACAAAAVLLLASGATACGDGGGDPPKSPASGVSSTPGAGSGTTGGIDPQPSDSASASGPADTTAAKREVEKNWTTFFDPAVPTREKAKVLENGTLLVPLLTAFNNDKRGGQSSAQVQDVRFNSATQAEVTYDLLLDGTPVLPGSKGTAVLQDNIWKVSVKSLCALVKLSGNAAARGC
ncbi:hypothetical protein ACH4SP_31520 [Streptomyces sp. NPDC021093]|uniref:hypothetical protein n=1 Tax=Streptomyces sp. NPDC021093 TaxID=3365112 RepID=UPI0037B46398